MKKMLEKFAVSRKAIARVQAIARSKQGSVKVSSTLWTAVAIVLLIVGAVGGYYGGSSVGYQTGFAEGYEKGYGEGLAAVPKPVTIEIGIVADVTGRLSKEGTDMWRAAQLAAKEINEAGGIWIEELGTYGLIKLHLGDTESTSEGGMRSIERLILDDKVDVLIGGYTSSITMAQEVVAVEHKVPWIVTGASTPLITHRTDIDTSYMFHHIAVAPTFGRDVMLWANEQLRPALIEKFGLTADYKLKVAILHVDDPFGEDTMTGAVDAVEKEKLAIEIVAIEKFEPPTTMFIEVLTKIKATKPDFLLSVGHIPHNIPIFTQARRDVGLKIFIAATENNDDASFYAGIGEWGDHMILQARWSTYTVPIGPTYDACIKLKENYKNMWGEYPGMMGVITYEGVYIYAKAIEIAGSLDKAKIVEALNKLEMPQMVQLIEGGKIFFTDDYREVPIRHFIQQMYHDATIGEPRPKVIWPADLKEPDAKLVIPDWYERG